ncbi:MAG TPA: M28 family peptidase [Flavihumibacter sp.]|nr:M28 family peptidase [Flavihumibacter sp.]
MKKIWIALIGFGLLALGTKAQTKTAWMPIFRQINEEVLTHSNAYNSLKEASTTIGHRLTGSENGKKAEEFAYNLLKSYGFTDVRYQPFEVESWSRKTISVSIGSSLKNLQPVKAVTLAHSPVKAAVKGELVDMGNGLEADYLAAPNKVKGKIAFVYLGILPGSGDKLQNLHRSEKTALATKYGAKGIAIYNTADGGILLTGTASVTGKLIPIPAVCIGKEDGFRIKDQLKTGKQFVDINMTNFSGIIKARNVIARINGTTKPNEKVVIGGHLDSWDLATGALDNGIGSFSVLDIARTFKALNLQPERSIEFVMFMGEEEGLLGSKAYLQQGLADKSLDQVVFMLNYDMTNDPKGYSATTDESKGFFQSVGAIAKGIDTSFTNIFRSGAGLHSDHQPFMLYGIPTGGAAGGKLPNNGGPCYHADCDDFKLVDDRGMRNTVRFNAMLLYAIADVPNIPARRLNDDETRELMIKSNLKEPLTIAGEWRWKD